MFATENSVSMFLVNVCSITFLSKCFVEERKGDEVSEQVIKAILCPERGIHSMNSFTQNFRDLGNQASSAWKGSGSFLRTAPCMGF